jgi:hypothetical protein
MTFHVGQHVVCVDDQNYLMPDPDFDGPQLKRGTIYTISAIADAPHNYGVALQVEELPWTVEIDGWFGSWRFRPLKKLTLEDFVFHDESRKIHGRVGA